jgi:hypothetical protein
VTASVAGRAADAPAAARAAAASRPRGALDGKGSFAAALFRARVKQGAPTGLAEARSATLATSAGPVLARRRVAAEERAASLRERRDEAEPGKLASGACLAADLAREPVAADGPPRIFAAAALDRVALEVGRLGDRPSLEVRLAADVAVRLTRAARGVEVEITVAAPRRRDAEAELPAIVAALRARGVTPSRAAVRTLAAAPAGGRSALTASGTFDTRAHPQQKDGTVAKW